MYMYIMLHNKIKHNRHVIKPQTKSDQKPIGLCIIFEWKMLIFLPLAAKFTSIIQIGGSEPIYCDQKTSWAIFHIVCTFCLISPLYILANTTTQKKSYPTVFCFRKLTISWLVGYQFLWRTYYYKLKTSV